MKLTIDLDPETALYLSRALEVNRMCESRGARRWMAVLLIRRGAAALIRARWIGEEYQVKFEQVPLTLEERAAEIELIQAERAARGLPPVEKFWPPVTF